MVKVAVPVLFTITGCEALDEPTFWLEKVSELVLRLTIGTGAATPVPDKETECGEPEALSVIVIDAERAPVFDGVKVTDRVQLNPAPKFDPQGLVNPKSPEFDPVTAIDENVSVALPEFVTRTV